MKIKGLRMLLCGGMKPKQGGTETGPSFLRASGVNPPRRVGPSRLPSSGPSLRFSGPAFIVEEKASVDAVVRTFLLFRSTCSYKAKRPPLKLVGLTRGGGIAQ
jgi:hypothetical protein